MLDVLCCLTVNRYDEIHSQCHLAIGVYREAYGYGSPDHFSSIPYSGCDASSIVFILWERGEEVGRSVGEWGGGG